MNVNEIPRNTAAEIIKATIVNVRGIEVRLLRLAKNNTTEYWTINKSLLAIRIRQRDCKVAGLACLVL